MKVKLKTLINPHLPYSNTQIEFLCVSEGYSIAVKLNFLLDTSYEICINPKWLPICTALIMFAGGFTYNFHIDVYFRSTSLERTQLLFVQLVLFI